MSRDSDSMPRHLQSELDQEQAVVDLDQGIADREQARVDRNQVPLDAAQQALNVAVPKPTADATQAYARRTNELALAQDRQDAHQAQLDQNQFAQAVRQNVLDHQQASLERPPQVSLAEVEDARARAGEELQQALRRRAADALARAEAARRRAADTLHRLEASQLRQSD